MNTETNPINIRDFYTNESMPKTDLYPDEVCEIENLENLHLPDEFQKSIEIKSPIIPNPLSLLFSENKISEDYQSPIQRKNPRSAKFRSSRYSIKNSPLERNLPMEQREIFSPIDKKRIKSRFFKVMLLYYIVKQFVKNMKRLTFPIKFEHLGKNHFKILNDLVFYREGLEKGKTQEESIKIRIQRKMMEFTENKCYKSFCHGFVKTLEKIMRFHIFPTHKFILFWEFFVILVTIFYFIIIPIEISFGNYNESFAQSFITLSISIFFIDMMVNFNTAFHSKGQLITSKAKIFQNYFYGRFFSDLFSLSFLILNQLLGYSSDIWIVKVFAFTYLLRVKNLSRAISQFEEFLFCDEDSSNLVSFVRLIVNILLFSHWSACLWKLVGSSDEENGWIAYYNIDNQSIFSQYVFSLYYVVVVINTVGFGDIVSQNIGERIFTIFFIYTACVIFAYTLNRIGIIVQNINKKESEFKKMMNTINGYMKFKNIAFELKIKIRNYLEYIWQAEKMQNLHETQEIINRLSKSLKEELLLNANGFTLKKIPLFRNNFSDETLRKLVCEIKEINLTPEDIIYHENQIDDQNMYIIRDGEVEISIPTSNQNKDIVLKKLKKGDYFGQISFFTGLPRNSTAKSLSFSSLFVVKKETFLSIISQNSNDYERFCEIKDEISLYDEYHGIFYNCSACLKKYHLLHECPSIHLVLSHTRVLERYNFSIPQKDRLNYNRLRKKKHPNALKFKKQTVICAKEYNNSYLKESADTFEKNSFNSFNNADDEQMKTSFKPMDSFQEESAKLKDKTIVFQGNDLKCVKSNHSFAIEGDHKDKELTKLSHEEAMPGLKKIVTNESFGFQGQQKWWFLIDNSTIDIDCVKNFDCYFPNKNMEKLILLINKIAMEKQKKLKSFHHFAEFWAGEKSKREVSLSLRKRNQSFSYDSKFKRRSSIFSKIQAAKITSETSLWNKIARYIRSIFKKI